ncbi:FAD-dependent oxidoreductase [Bacillus velezensis]
MNQQTVNVIGAGLAGSEAAWQLAKRGIQVKLYEMRPVRQTAAHHTDKFAELVCSNSLRSNTLANAVGVLKKKCGPLTQQSFNLLINARFPQGSACS